jgi:alkylation response protein AidB-like acyl-CoA dehydrogenase
MDFQLTQEQRDLKDLAAKIFGDLAPSKSLPAFEEPQDWFDERIWAELAKASLLGIGIPESYGGAGMGLIEACVVLEESGRRLAPAPLLPCMIMGAAPIVEFGTEEQKRTILPAVSAGKEILTAAWVDAASSASGTPATRARTSDGGWRLDGAKEYVPAARLASRILVPATTDDGRVALFLVHRDARGVTLEAQAATTGELEYRVALSDVSVPASAKLGGSDDGETILRWAIERTIAGICAIELGVAETALRMTADYTGKRKQFGKPIATFQAVAQRAADAYIDLDAMRLSTLQAIWRLASGLDASRELAIAKFWASEGGHRVCYAAQHLHGGIGVDTDYPLHHYYLRSRHLELTLGGAHTHLAVLGDRLAEHGPAVNG